MSDTAAVLPPDGNTSACQVCGLHVGSYTYNEEGYGDVNVCAHCYGDPHEDEPCVALPGVGG